MGDHSRGRRGCCSNKYYKIPEAENRGTLGLSCKQDSKRGRGLASFKHNKNIIFITWLNQNLSCIPVLYQACPVSVLSCIRPVLYPSCPVSSLFCRYDDECRLHSYDFLSLFYQNCATIIANSFKMNSHECK